jgi:hypothetical protein
MDEDQDVEGAFPALFGERKIMFNQPTEGQMAVIGKAVWLAKRGGANVINGIGLILNVIDKLVIEAEDRNWLEDGLMDGSVKLNDFIGVLDGMNGGTAADEKPKGKKLAKAARAGDGSR